MKITKELLIAAGMPPWDVRTFTVEWPEGAEITVENIARAGDIGLSTRYLLHAISDDRTYRCGIGRQEDKLRDAEIARHREALDAINRQKLEAEQQWLADALCRAVAGL